MNREHEKTLMVVGGGLAGSEAAWQAAQRGIRVRLYEMRPKVATGAHVSPYLAELVCSNSLGSTLPDRAAGLLKAELRRLGSLLLQAAEESAVPAGSALAVDREVFAQKVTAALENHPNITIVREEVTDIPDQPAIIASGPLTSPRLSQALARLTGQEHLYFYDAIAPSWWPIPSTWMSASARPATAAGSKPRAITSTAPSTRPVTTLLWRR